MKFQATAVSLILFAMTSFALADPPSYPLLCHGGPGMKIMTNHDVDGRGIPGATAMFIYFKPAAKPGSVSQPRPGECVWLDRTFRQGELEVMWIKSPNIEFAFQIMGNGRVAVDTTGPRLNVEGTKWSKEARDWEYLVDGVMKGKQFTAHVYNSGGNVMAITKVGP